MGNACQSAPAEDEEIQVPSLSFPILLILTSLPLAPRQKARTNGRIRPQSQELLSKGAGKCGQDISFLQGQENQKTPQGRDLHSEE